MEDLCENNIGLGDITEDMCWWTAASDGIYSCSNYKMENNWMVLAFFYSIIFIFIFP